MKRLGLALALFLAACSGSRQGPDAPAQSSAFPLQAYGAAAGEAPVYRIDPEISRADVLVRREGTLARLGHDHVITFATVRGYVRMAGDDLAARADLEVDVSAPIVDAADARAVYGLDTQPSPGAIAGTSRNLARHVLDSARWPVVRIQIDDVERSDPWARVMVTLTVRGRTIQFPSDVLLEENEDLMRASGLFTVRQTDLAIEPFTALGGALRVADRVVVHFRIRAERVRSPVPAPGG